jgi:sugar phosphate isomerase/epimerase
VHAYSPVPLGAPSGHPELFLMAATDEDSRRLALFHMRHTLEFAAFVGARVVVAHAGRVPVGARWARHVGYQVAERTDHWRYRWNRKRLQQARQRLVGRHLESLRRSLDELLPRFAEAGVVLALENLPSGDALPDAAEMIQLADHYKSPHLRYWHDIGHGQIMENAGWGNHLDLARQMLTLTAGVHIHDVRPPMQDHCAPGSGALDFSCFGFYADPDILHVFEPASTVTPGDLKTGLELLQKTWGADNLHAKGKGIA